MKKTCIIDSSSAILLHKSGLLESLFFYYCTTCPSSVVEEITRNPEYPGAGAVEKYITGGLLLPYPSDSSDFPDHQKSLGRGERDCISLFCRIRADFIICDDKKACIFCKRKKIPFINALLFPRILFLSHCFSDKQMREHQKELISQGRYSLKIIEFAEKASEDDLNFFLP